MRAEGPLVLWLHLKGTEDKLLGFNHLSILKKGRLHLNMAVEEVKILRRWRPFHHLVCGTRNLHKLRDLPVLSKGLRWRDIHPCTRMLLHSISGRLINPIKKQRRDVAFLGFDAYDHPVSSSEIKRRQKLWIVLSDCMQATTSPIMFLKKKMKRKRKKQRNEQNEISFLEPLVLCFSPPPVVICIFVIID